jgi:hypothetical protein
MNAIHQVTPRSDAAFSGADPEMGAGNAPEGDPPTQWTLRRTGRKPVRFNGWQVLEACGLASQDGIGHALNVYRTVAGAIVIELAAQRAMMDEADLLRVEVFVNLCDAAQWLQSYRCTSDIPIAAGLTDSDEPLALTVMRTVRLRRQILRVEEEYQALLSDVFAALDVTDSVEDLLAPVLANNVSCS